MKFNTPIQEITEMYQIGDNRLFIKRDDLLPLSFGGNKARIAQEFYADMERQGKNCMVGYGNVRSNLCRVLANLGTIRNVPCHIISPEEEGDALNVTANRRLAEICGAVVHPCAKTKVAETIEQVMADCEAQGLMPYYINGNKFGKGNEAVPVNAYLNAYREIRDYSDEGGVSFDYIFLATGTGMTQAGLLAGQHLLGGNGKIFGISVARGKTAAEVAVRISLEAYAEKERMETVSSDDIQVIDDYLCGGYGKYNEAVQDTVFNLYQKTGIALDPTYTGKAFWGMENYLMQNDLQGRNVLFIHTGSAPLFFDFLKGK